MDGWSVEDIAEHLGVKPKTLWNRFGRGRWGNDYSKLAKPVREEVGQLVGELPEHHLHRLIRHLLDEAGLSRGVVERLLGVRVPDQVENILLTEDELLQELGWDEKKFFGKAGRSVGRKGLCMVENHRSRRCG